MNQFAGLVVGTTMVAALVGLAAPATAHDAGAGPTVPARVAVPGEISTGVLGSGGPAGSWSGRSPAASPGLGQATAPGDLSAIAAVSPDDVWAVGGVQSGGTYLPVAEHWDGHGWSQVPTAIPSGTSKSYLQTVTAISTDDVWAAGAETLSDGVTMRTLIEHWNGRKWRLVDSPSVDGDWNMLNGIDAVSSDDVWVVGAGGAGTAIKTLVEHWDGHTWRIVSSPNVQVRPANQLNHVAVVSADDVWAVGYSAVLSQQYSTLAEHWNGRKWRIVKTPNLHDPNFDLQDVSAVSSHDVWAVGSYWSDDDQTFKTLTERWDGDAWTVVPSPNPKTPYVATFPLAVSAGSKSDVWSSGWYELPNGNEVPLMEHWNGHRWKVTDTPEIPNTPDSNLIGLATISSNDAWAVGSLLSGGQWCTLYEHWNGDAWKVIEQK
jgi:hypothetical protein